MAAGNVPTWEKSQELRPSGTFHLLGDGSVRFVGPSLSHIVHDVAAHSRHRSISDVIVGTADASGWKPIRPGQYSWAFHTRRPQLSTTGAPVDSQGIIAILIGLLLPATDPTALKLLRPYLIAGARLHLVAGHKFTLESHAPASSFNGYDAGFTGGVFVAT
jgi:hypothetical protein